MERDKKLELIGRVPFWFHSVDLGDGVITPGFKTSEILAGETANMKLPDVQGKTVLDIGAWDGYFSFEAERRGARRVLALDHYVWSMDCLAHHNWASSRNQRGVPLVPYHHVPTTWKPHELPGKKGFDTCHQILESNVEQLVADFMTVNLEAVGAFDIVFFFGVLYHLEEPLRALRRLALLTRETAVIETAAVYVPGFEHVSLYEFYETTELGGDIGNWWAPNKVGLEKACRAAGFKTVEVVSPYPPIHKVVENGVERYRLTVQAHA